MHQARPEHSPTRVDWLVTDDGRRVLVFDRCTGALTVLAFVLGVVAVVVGGFGAVALVADVPSRALGAVFLAVGVSFAAVTYAVVRKFRRRRSQPLHECRSVAVGGAVVPLDRVHFARKLQIGSSSPELVAVTPGGTHVLKRGNPFDGGIGNVDEILTHGRGAISRAGADDVADAGRIPCVMLLERDQRHGTSAVGSAQPYARSGY